MVPNVPPVAVTRNDEKLVVDALIVNVIVAVLVLDVNVVLVDEIVQTTLVEVDVAIERLNVLELNVVDPVVPDTIIDPLVVVFAVGVNLAVYVVPLPLMVPNTPPVTVTRDDEKLVVELFIVKVIVAVCPLENVVLDDEIAQTTLVEVDVAIERLNVLELNVVDPVVPDTIMDPLVVVFAVGVNVAVYVVPLPLMVPNVPPLTVTRDDEKLVVELFIVKVIVAVCPLENVVLDDEIVQYTFVVSVNVRCCFE